MKVKVKYGLTGKRWILPTCVPLTRTTTYHSATDTVYCAGHIGNLFQVGGLTVKQFVKIMYT